MYMLGEGVRLPRCCVCRMHHLRMVYTHSKIAKYVVYAKKLVYLGCCLISICDGKMRHLRA